MTKAELIKAMSDNTGIDKEMTGRGFRVPYRGFEKEYIGRLKHLSQRLCYFLECPIIVKKTPSKFSQSMLVD